MNDFSLSSVGTPYLQILDDSLQRWNDTLSAFEAYNAANWADYSLAATQDGSSGDWYVQIPAAISAGLLVVKQYLQAGGSPAESDWCEAQQTFYWDGTSLIAGGGKNITTETTIIVSD